MHQEIFMFTISQQIKQIYTVLQINTIMLNITKGVILHAGKELRRWYSQNI